MTAVEWLAEQLYPAIKLDSKIIDSFVGVAKEMEKQQIIDAHSYGQYYCHGCNEPSAEQYYNETYGSKGSDETFKVWECCGMEDYICEGVSLAEKDKI